jgi:hypothetical protein
MKGKLRDAIVDRMAMNEKMPTRYLNERDFEDVAFQALVKRVYEDFKVETGEP